MELEYGAGILGVVLSVFGTLVWRRRRANHEAAEAREALKMQAAAAKKAAELQAEIDTKLSAALTEQVRRESTHDVSYRIDQRVTAIQQRLSRQFGQHAFTDRSRVRILEEILKNDVLGPRSGAARSGGGAK